MNCRIVCYVIALVGSICAESLASGCLGSKSCNSARNCSRMRVTHSGSCEPCTVKDCRRKNCNACHGECVEGACPVVDRVEDEEEDAE